MATTQPTAKQPTAKQPTTKQAKQPTAKQPTVPTLGYQLTGQQPVKPYRANSARALWYAAVTKALANGQQPASKLFAAHIANPPSTPKAGKLAGQCEPPAGWYSYFVREGVVKAVTVQVPA